MKTAYATIKGIEVMRALRKGQHFIMVIPGRNALQFKLKRTDPHARNP